MYIGLLHIHGILRWLILISALVAIIFAYSGWFTQRSWKKTDNLWGTLLMIFTDLQLLIGLLLYFIFSPLVQAAFGNFGEAMKTPELRFYAVEHFFMMVVAIVLIHVGRAKAKKTTDPVKKHRVSALFYTLALIVMLAAIPWSRGLF